MPREIDPLTVFNKSADNLAMDTHWTRSMSVVAGIDAMREKTTVLLPKFIDEDDTRYNFRLDNTVMTNIYNDVLGPLADKPFEKDITIEGEATPEVEDFINDVDGANGNITTFSKVVFYNGINNAIHWVMIDHPKKNESVRTLAEQKALGIRPYWSNILAQNVLEAETDRINGSEKLVFIRILEPDVKGNTYCRVFDYDSEVNKVFWSLYKKDSKGKHELVEEGVLTIDEIPIVYFITGLREGTSFRIKPPLKDAVDLQVFLYQQESALNFACVLSAFPILVGSGVNPPKEADGVTPKKIHIGPSTILFAPPNGKGDSGTWEFIEPSATSLTFLDARIAKYQQQLRELGKQPLTAQSSQMTTITTAVAAGKAKSAVKAWCVNLKQTLENALRITAKFKAFDQQQIDVEVFTDFDDGISDGSDVSTLLQMRRNKDISRDQLVLEVKRRNILSEEYDADDDLEKILAEVPADEVVIE